ncbi:Rho GTPase activation protein [Wallemia mellicola]|uniref:Rho GTPase activation protein n=1 Tax=Wallemia mellicola TaxID=1708541 RepID=A0A4T0M2H1_9BASI|nr:Rho GTPase activation protein [Wallemia mellicola]
MQITKKDEYLEPSSPTISPALIYFIQNSQQSSTDEQSQKVARSTPTISSPKFESTTEELNKRPLSVMFNNVGGTSGQTYQPDDDNDRKSNRSSSTTITNGKRNSQRRRTKPSLQIFNSPSNPPSRPPSMSISTSNIPQAATSSYSPSLKSVNHYRNISTDYLSNKIQGWMPNFSNSLSTPQISSESSSFDNSYKDISNTATKDKDKDKDSKRGMLGKAFSSLHFNDISKVNHQTSISNFRTRVGKSNQKLVFGVNLQQSSYYTKIDKSTSLWKIPIEAKDHLPCLIIRCFEYLIQWAIVEEGIFRISGKSSQILQLKNEFDSGSDINLRDIHPSVLDPHAVASIFKAYLRELPHNILSNETIPQFNDFMQITYKVNAVTSDDAPAAAFKCNYNQTEGKDFNQLDLKLLKDILNDLPCSNYWLLRLTMKILKLTADNSDINKMTLSNLILVICPSVNLSAQFVKVLVTHFDVLFGSDDVEDSEEEELGYLRSNTPSQQTKSTHNKFRLLKRKK